MDNLSKNSHSRSCPAREKGSMEGRWSRTTQYRWDVGTLLLKTGDVEAYRETAEAWPVVGPECAKPSSIELGFVVWASGGVLLSHGECHTII
ncbi:hypothetical protein, partial [Chromobacterium violaceum]